MNFPSPGDGTASRTRATDAQRTAVWKALDSALDDGRLDRLEHLERTRTVFRTRFVDELRPLVADLRGDDDLGLDEDEPATGSGDADTAVADDSDTGAGRQDRPAGRGLRTGVLVGVAALGVVVVAALASNSSSSSGSEPAPPGPLHTADGMAQMLDAAETEFGDLPIDTLSVYGDRANLMHEDPTDPGTRLSHAFRGGWEETSFSQRTDSATFHLDDIDPAVVMNAVDAAPEQLDMAGAETSHVTVFADALSEPEYRVTLSDGDDMGTVTVGADGEVRDVSPPD